MKDPEKPVVLIVEDEACVRSLSAEILEDAGFCAVEASNADEALRILRQRCDIRVVFTDVEMPGSLDGLALAWRIREAWPRIGLVLTSGGWPLSKKAMPREGFFMQKPYSGAALVRRIRDVTSGLMGGAPRPCVFVNRASLDSVA